MGDAPHGNTVPETETETKYQEALLLQTPRSSYALVTRHDVPTLRPNEVLVRNYAIGLNPIDWKAPDYNFGIPGFPCLSGRELSGQIHQSSHHLQKHDRVIVISTDYRDIRKGAYQQYVAALHYNVARIPLHVSYEKAATVGVAFVTAALSLGICLGVDFSNTGGPNLYDLARRVDPNSIPEDTRSETLHSIQDHERAVSGDWIIIWGGSSVSAHIAAQLARLAGLKIALVVDQARHGAWISDSLKPDILVDSHDTSRAVEIIHSTIGKSVRHGIDTRSKESAELLGQCLQQDNRKSLSPPSTPPYTPQASRSHAVSLTGTPKTSDKRTVWHSVPIKLFHDVPEIGTALTQWLEWLLQDNKLQFPRIIDVEYGLDRVNHALDRMRQGEVRGGKLVVRLG